MPGPASSNSSLFSSLIAPSPLAKPSSSASSSSESLDIIDEPDSYEADGAEDPLDETSSETSTKLYDLPRTIEESISSYIFEESTPSRPRPRAFTLSHSAFGSFGTFPSTARAGPLPAPTVKSRIRLFFCQLLSNAASAGFLALIVAWALSARGLTYSLNRLRGKQGVERKKREWDDQKTYENEAVVKDMRYYARNCGFDVIEQEVETKDGYLLKVFKVEVLGQKEELHSDGRGGYPVLIQHGLFQSCGSFITSEERSLAFWLAKTG